MRLFLAATLLTAGLIGSAIPAVAQDSTLSRRVDRLESEMNAVQRKVFPGGAGRNNYVQPQISPAAPTEQPGYGTPASSPLTDLNARVTSLEQQMSTLTNSVEESQHRLQVLEQNFADYKQATDQRLATLQGGGGAAAPAGALSAAGNPPIDSDAAASIGAGTDSSSPPSQAVANGWPAAAAVEKPSTGDEEEDAYIYGYRLWAAKQYPQAEKQLKAVVDKWPGTRRASYAQNLLGRSYLDEGKPSLASIAFYDNYKKMPDGERAPDSLYYLAQALVQLKKPADACKVYSELSDVYGSKISADMKADIAKGRSDAQCQ